MMGMKSNTIKLILKNKLKAWIDTIKDETLQHEISENCIISGGCIASMLLGEKVNDYDIYFKNFETAHKVARYYVTLYNSLHKPKNPPYVVTNYATNIKGETELRIFLYTPSAGVSSADDFQNNIVGEVESFESEDPVELVKDVKEEIKTKKEKFIPLFISENAITLSDKVQLIIRFSGDAQKIQSNFDFAHAFCYYDSYTEELTLPAESLECLLSKTLIYKGSLYPIASLFRIRKFLKRGFRISAGQILKIVWQVNSLDLSNKETLREQLMGVDQTYMYQLIRAIENSEERIDATYIANLIDTIFEETSDEA